METGQEEKTYRDEWESFKEYVSDTYDADDRNSIQEGGCVSGAAGRHIYYRDTCATYEKFSVAIWDKLTEEAENFGHKNALQFVGSFGGAEHVCTTETFENLLCWWAIETACNELA